MRIRGHQRKARGKPLMRFRPLSLRLFRKSCGSCRGRQSEAFRSVQARPDGFDRASWLRPRLERLGAGVVAIAGLMTGAARLIPYCARHHPLHLKDNGCRGSACSPLSGQEGRRPQTARVRRAHHPPHFLRGGWLGWPSLRASTEHSIRPCPELINPECATREHVRPPALHAPLVTCAMREHEGLAWPPRLSALRQPRRRFPEVPTL